MVRSSWSLSTSSKKFSSRIIKSKRDWVPPPPGLATSFLPRVEELFDIDPGFIFLDFEVWLETAEALSSGAFLFSLDAWLLSLLRVSYVGFRPDSPTTTFPYPFVFSMDLISMDTLFTLETAATTTGYCSSFLDYYLDLFWAAFELFIFEI